MIHVCGKCRVDMKIKKNGVTVGRAADSKWVRQGDLWVCPKCQQEVLTGFGTPYNGETGPEVVVG